MRTDTTQAKPKQGKKKAKSPAACTRSSGRPTATTCSARTSLRAGAVCRPPYHGLWKLKARADIEFPPSVAYGKVYVAQQKGRFFAVNARTGKVVWTRHFTRCAAASPTIANGIVYQAYMHELPCRKHAGGADGFVVAWNARNGKEYWRVRAGSVESSPVVVGKNLYFGSWDHHLYAYRLRGKQRPLLRWTFTADDQIVAAPAHAGRTLYIATSSGSVYGVDAKTGRQVLARDVVRALRAARVLLRDADGRLRARLHRERGRHRLRLRGRHRAPALGARGRDVRLHGGRGLAEDRLRRHLGRDVHRARRAHRGAALALRRSRRGSRARRPCSPGSSTSRPAGGAAPAGCARVKIGPRRTFGLNARNGDPIWRFHDGKYSALVADGFRVYISGRNKVYALIPELRCAAAPEGEGPGEVRGS